MIKISVFGCIRALLRWNKRQHTRRRSLRLSLMRKCVIRRILQFTMSHNGMAASFSCYRHWTTRFLVVYILLLLLRIIFCFFSQSFVSNKEKPITGLLMALLCLYARCHHSPTNPISMNKLAFLHQWIIIVYFKLENFLSHTMIVHHQELRTIKPKLPFLNIRVSRWFKWPRCVTAEQNWTQNNQSFTII